MTVHLKAHGLRGPLPQALLTLTLAVGVLASVPARAADDVAALLAAADRWRAGSDAMQIETEVSVLARDGTLQKQRRYTVFMQAGRKSLVLMRSPAEAGQKVLMLGDDFWLLMPGSQRALRITPSQKLLGDAATGDIATLRWAEDYGGMLQGEAACPSPDEARACRHLSLVAARKGVTYARIELWIGRARSEPVAAELFVQSDKLAKRARFLLQQGQVQEMLLQDELGGGRITRVRYLERHARTVPEAWLNPMFLARNPEIE